MLQICLIDIILQSVFPRTHTPRLKEVKLLAQGYRAIKWQTWCIKISLRFPSTEVFTLYVSLGYRI